MTRTIKQVIKKKQRKILPSFKKVTKRRNKPGVRSLKEIRFYQSTTGLLLRKRPFMRLVKEVTKNMTFQAHFWQLSALEALQEAAETYLTHLFEQTNLAALHAKRVTILPRDVEFIMRIKDDRLI
ncbi:uncharacterized protein LOC128395766 [Panonychus citri]|uniref:uncharacterized protein LOC128395766 n=1 Tax=Panonychus citri TaxID=50023 RepID=UPI0023078624|nr:uncharacterized protein LOC128395766 [Panonychus citri]